MTSKKISDNDKTVKDLVELHKKVLALLDDVPLSHFILIAASIVGEVIRDSSDDEVVIASELKTYTDMFKNKTKNYVRRK